ncbi:MAG: SDR family NAD(P)-dependent oxidoreductase [Candidatus Promineifilaceae bacterium]
MAESKVPPTRPLERKPVAIVVGASSGIGAALVRELIHQGYYVAAIARREARLNELCEAINTAASNGVQAFPYTHNVTHYSEVPILFQQISGELGQVDLIVYVAAVQPTMAANEYNFEKDQAMVQTNLMGAMAWLGQAAVYFERAKKGQIVGISSIAADRGRRLNPAYNASKAGLDTYLEGLRNRLSQHGVTVTTIKPGFVDTVLLENAPKTFWVISPTKAAELIYKAVRGKKQLVYVPGRWRLVSLVIRNIPSVVFRRMNM